jgi:hypothetical protein
VQAGAGTFWGVWALGRHPDGRAFNAAMIVNGGIGASGRRDGLSATSYPWNSVATSSEIYENHGPGLGGGRPLPGRPGAAPRLPAGRRDAGHGRPPAGQPALPAARPPGRPPGGAGARPVERRADRGEPVRAARRRRADLRAARGRRLRPRRGARPGAPGARRRAGVPDLMVARGRVPRPPGRAR